MNKIGGVPDFVQQEEYREIAGEKWNLILQLAADDIPFSVNFGDSGVGYPFISSDGKKAKFLWQCY